MRVLGLAIVLAGTVAAAQPAVHVSGSAHGPAIRRELERGFADAAGTIDASLVTLAVSTAGEEVAVRAELRIVISDEHREMRWSGSATSTIRVPARSYRPSDRPALEHDAVVEASRQLAARFRRFASR